MGRRVRGRGQDYDRWFDHWQIAEGESLKGLVASTVLMITDGEQRTRKRTVKAQRDFERAVEAVVVNLAYLVVRPSLTGCLAVIQDDGHRLNRYEHPSLSTKTVRKVLVPLKGKLLTYRQGKVRVATSTIKPTPEFAEEVSRLRIGPEDFARDPDEEVLILTWNEKSFVYRNGERKPITTSKRINYTDNENLYGLRQQVRDLNARLQSAQLEFVDDELLPTVCSEDRTMRRTFNSGNKGAIRWDLNGRLYGGFWQNLKRNRRQHIRINGEPVCDLDYQNAFARLAYIHVQQEHPQGDQYDLTGILAGYDNEHETHRDGVKAGFNALLNGGAADVEDILNDLPEGTTAKAFRNAVAIKHPGLVGVFGTHLGLSLMYTESRILLNALERLKAQGIVALGMHDGLMVGTSHLEAAQRAMEAASDYVIGQRLVVVCKANYGQPEATEGLLAA